MEGVTGCSWDDTLGCHEECAYDVGICQACGCVVIMEDCVTPTVMDEALNAPMRIDVFDALTIENQMIEGVDDAYVYVGITMFALMFIGGACFMFYKSNKRRKKKAYEEMEDNVHALQMDEIEVEEFGTR